MILGLFSVHKINEKSEKHNPNHESFKRILSAEKFSLFNLAPENQIESHTSYANNHG
jgi:hypothetical protein